MPKKQYGEPNFHSKRRHTRLGQHFLTRPEIAGWVADAAHLTKDDTVLEIGPGHGILTRELLARAGRVVALEKDPALVAELRNTFAAEIISQKLTLIEQDVRDFDPASCLLPPAYSLAANIPYYLTGFIIRRFLTAEKQPKTMALLVQKEVAERIVARDGKESLLSLSVKAYGMPQLVRVVKAGAFSPPPKVDSAILAIYDISRTIFENRAEEKHFFDLSRLAFSTKRKKVHSTLGKHISQKEFDICNVPKSARPEDIQPAQWLCVIRPHIE